MALVYPLPFPIMVPSSSWEELSSYQLFNWSEDQNLAPSFSPCPRVSGRSVQPPRVPFLHTARRSADTASFMKATMFPPSSCDYMDILDEMAAQSPPMTVLAPPGPVASGVYEHLAFDGMDESTSNRSTYWLLPQPGARHGNESNWHIWPIAFLRNDDRPAYTIADLIGDLHEPLNIQGASDTPFEEFGEGTLTVRIEWPGYMPYDREIRTDGGTISRDELLLCVARIVDRFAQKVYTENKPQIRQGYEEYRLRTHTYRAGIFHDRCVIGGLTLYADGTWRPDIYVPFE